MSSATRRTELPTAPDIVAVQGEIARLDGIGGVLLQTGFAATVAAFTIVATVKQLSTLREVVLIAAGIFSVIATILAAAGLTQSVKFTDLSLDESKLLKTLAAKKWRYRLALSILAATIELTAAIIVCSK